MFPALSSITGVKLRTGIGQLVCLLLLLGAKNGYCKEHPL